MAVIPGPAPDWLLPYLLKDQPTPASVVQPPSANNNPAERIRQRLRDAELGVSSQSYGARALAEELAKVRATPEGSRNHQLNIAAMKLGQLVAGGVLERDVVERELTAAGYDAGQGKQTGPTVASGLRKGLTEPRTPAPRPAETPRVAAAVTREPKPADEPTEAADDRFGLWTPAELIAADQEFSWTLRGMLVDPTYGMIAGERKTLKSYVATFLNLAVASGQPLFGKFGVDNPGPVVAYVGEGGRLPYTRRLVRVAEAMGIGLADLMDIPLRSAFDVAPIASERFADSLARDIDSGPRLINIDPYYAYHGLAANASNLFEEGALLSRLSVPCMAAGVNLLVNNHFNKTGSGNGLSRLTQSGAQEWCDTWILLSHRQGIEANVEHGEFHLCLEIGSRQWGGTSWDLDLSIGRLDPETGQFDGSISWDIDRAGGLVAEPKGREDVVSAVGAAPGQYSRDQLAQRLGGRKEDALRVIDSAVTEGVIEARSVPVEDSKGRSRAFQRLFLPETVVPAGTAVGNGCPR